jgi:hypothetical protein
MLQKTVSPNNLHNVTPVQLAISDKPGKLWITSLKNNEENSVFSKQSNGSIAVPTLELLRR